jgi:glycosyltransferase involved in cell wall biosynthesis
MALVSAPLVSIACITFNHKSYIRQCIKGFLIQKTTFPIEIIIHDDASTDDTAVILQEYAEKYPDLIFPIFQKENQFSQGINPGVKFVIPKCKGKYIAICEGDDYWTDPYKLQKQVNFLDQNPKYALVASDVALIDEHGNVIPDNKMLLEQRWFRKPEVSFFDLLQTNLINTLTVCVRAEHMQELSRESLGRNLNFVIDKWFWLNIAMKHKIRLFYNKTAAYRVHSNGASHNNEFMSWRVSMISYDVLKKFIRSVDVSGLNSQDLSILANSLFNLIFSKYLGIIKKLDILKDTIKSPRLELTIIKITINRALNKFRKN